MLVALVTKEPMLCAKVTLKHGRIILMRSGTMLATLCRALRVFLNGHSQAQILKANVQRSMAAIFFGSKMER